jgi:putative protease
MNESISKEKQVGFVTHYFTNIMVAVVELTDILEKGNTIHIKGATTDFMQKVESMQIEHNEISRAERRQAIGLKVKQLVHDHDMVYKVEGVDSSPKYTLKKP